MTRRNTPSLVKSKNFRCKAHSQGPKFAPLCRRKYRSYGIKVFGDLASLLDVFGNISKYRLIEVLNHQVIPKPQVCEMGENFRLQYGLTKLYRVWSCRPRSERYIK